MNSIIMSTRGDEGRRPSPEDMIEVELADHVAEEEIKVEIDPFPEEPAKHDEAMKAHDLAAQQSRILKEQIKFFIIIYLGYVSVHLFREFWAMSKKSLILEA